MIIEFPITSDYIPGWTEVDGLREMIQNALDQEITSGRLCSIRYRKDRGKEHGTITLLNPGAQLSQAALLIGESSKRGDTKTIGEHGEGLNLGMLALCRKGLQVKLETNLVTWTPSVGHSATYQRPVLKLNVAQRRGQISEDDYVRVTVSGVSPEMWLDVKGRFLRLREDVQVPTPETTESVVPNFPGGHIFIKGVYVTKVDADLSYNLVMKTNRDRGMVDGYELYTRIASVLNASARRDPKALRQLYGLLRRERPDIKYLYNFQMSPDVTEGLAKLFREEFGGAAVPIMTENDRIVLEHYGKVGVVVSEKLHGALENHFDSARNLQEKYRNSVKEIIPLEELSPREKKIYTQCIAALQRAGVPGGALEEVRVVEFSCPEVRGLYLDKEISIARSSLVSAGECFGVLIHEVAHHFGGDASLQHVDMMQYLWCKIYDDLWEKTE